MSINDIFNFLKDHTSITLLFLALVEITPIKINPISSIVKWVGKTANAEMYAKFDKIQSDMQSVKQEFETKNATDARWYILDFANSCRNNRRHDKEEWTHVLTEIKAYEDYVTKHNIPNAVIEEDSKYLRELYHEISDSNNFLVTKGE